MQCSVVEIDGVVTECTIPNTFEGEFNFSTFFFENYFNTFFYNES